LGQPCTGNIGQIAGKCLVLEPLELTCLRKSQRRRSGRYSQSAPGPCSAKTATWAQTASSFRSHRWLLKLAVLGQRKTLDISASPLKRQASFLR